MTEKPRFEILEQIGHGQFSNVYKARWINAPSIPSRPSSPDTQSSLMHTPTDQLQKPLELICLSNHQQVVKKDVEDNDAHHGGAKYVALKKIQFYDMANSKQRMDCVKEVKLLQQLKHPNIINYNISFIEKHELYIVLELADGGDLSKLIRYFQRRRQLLSEKTILKYFTQVCSAVGYIHSKRILHRDIKPANIFMTSDGCVKLGDFGLGRFFSQNTCNAHTIVGTFYYMSPERICESGYGFSSDVWSLGCVLYELITLNSPFSIYYMNSNDFTMQQRVQDNNGMSRYHPVNNQAQQQINLKWLIDRICRAEYPSLAGYTDISQRLRQLTTECLNPNPEARPNMEYICAVVGEAYRLQLLPPSSKTNNKSLNRSQNSDHSSSRC